MDEQREVANYVGQTIVCSQPRLRKPRNASAYIRASSATVEKFSLPLETLCDYSRTPPRSRGPHSWQSCGRVSTIIPTVARLPQMVAKYLGTCLTSAYVIESCGAVLAPSAHSRFPSAFLVCRLTVVNGYTRAAHARSFLMSPTASLASGLLGGPIPQSPSRISIELSSQPAEYAQLRVAVSRASKL
jgi:hypothetical protein